MSIRHDPTVADESDLLENEGRTFGDFIDTVGQRFWKEDALIAEIADEADVQRIKWSYGDLWRNVLGLQNQLSEMGLTTGDRVALLLSSFPEWILYFFAVTRLGGIVVPMNPRFGSSEVEYVLKHCEANVLVSMGRYLGRDYAEMISAVVGDDWGPGREARLLPSLRLILGVGPSTPHRAAIGTSELLAKGLARLKSTEIPPSCSDTDAVAVLFYTSGTTSFPKAVQLTHRNILPHSIRCGRHFEILTGERVLSLYPFFGAAGGANKIVSTFAFGGCLVFQDSYRATGAFDLLDSEGCTVLHAVDVQVRDLIEVAEQRARTGVQRRGTIAFVAGLDNELARKMGESLGVKRFIHPYGMTETNPMILRNEFDDDFETSLRPGGQPAPGVVVQVVVPGSLQVQDVDTPGEIIVSGEVVSRGYFRGHEANADAFVEGWFRTRDLGVRTADGSVFYMGRLGDILKIGGFNVAPQEVETFLRTHEMVCDAAVTSVPDQRLGHVVAAFVKCREGSVVDEEDIQSYCRSRIANFKIPRHVFCAQRLPYHSAAHGSKLKRDVVKRWARLRVRRV